MGMECIRQLGGKNNTIDFLGKMMRKLFSGLAIAVLCACTTLLVGPFNFTYSPIKTQTFEIATWHKTNNAKDPIHIYIEGDGRAFNSQGQPTDNPTPRDMFLRNLVGQDEHTNIAYIGRPCQFVDDPTCKQSDWTDGRFSANAVDAVAVAIKTVAKGRPIILVGYSGGAMISGLIIQRHPEMNIQKWITIAGVLNHADWTEHFGDQPLSKSLDMCTLPRIKQLHYVAENDTTVPVALSRKWIADERNLVVVPDAKHNLMPGIEINFK